MFCDARDIRAYQFLFSGMGFEVGFEISNFFSRVFKKNSFHQHENKNLISCENAMVPHQESKKNHSRGVISSCFYFLNKQNHNSIGGSILEPNINHNMQFSGDQEAGDITNTFLSKLFYQRDFYDLHSLPIRKKNELWYNQVSMKWNESIEALKKELSEKGEEYKKNLLEKDQEISILKKNNNTLGNEYCELEKNNKELKNKNNVLSNQLKEVRDDLEKQKTNNMTLEEQNQNQQDKNKTLEKEKKYQQSKIDAQERKLIEQEKMILEYNERQNKLEIELYNLSKELEKRQADLTEKEKLINDGKDKLANLDKQLKDVNVDKSLLLSFFSKKIKDDDVDVICKMIKEHKKKDLDPEQVKSSMPWWKQVYHKAKSWVRIYRSYEEIEDQRKFIDNLKEISNGLNYSYECIDHESSLWDIFKKSLTVSFGGYTRLGKCAMIGGLGAAGYIGCKFMPWSSLVGGTLPFFMEYWKFIIPALLGGGGFGTYVWSSCRREELTRAVQVRITQCNQCQKDCNQNAKLCGTCESKQIDNKNV